MLPIKHGSKKGQTNRTIEHKALGIHTAAVSNQTGSFAVRTGWVLHTSKQA